MSSAKRADALSSLGDRMKSSVEAARRGLRRTQLEAELAAAHLRLGKAVAEQELAQPFLPPLFDAGVRQIAALRQAIEATRHSSSESADPATCSHCHRALPADAAFCPGCGQRIE